MKPFLATLIMLILNTSIGFSQMKSAAFLADIDQLSTLIKTKHVAPFRLVTQKRFRKIVTNAKKIIESKEDCDEQCYVELFKIIAALNDGHSLISSSSREALFGYLPITTTWFEDGLYLTRTTQKDQALIGSKLVAINQVDIATVLNKLKEVLPHGNESRFKKFAYAYLRLPGLLYGLGITDDPAFAKFSFSRNGQINTLELKNMSDEEYDNTNFVSYQKTTNKLPLHAENETKYYWYEYDATNKVFYFKYNRIGNMEAESASAFATRMWAEVDALEIDKFILDIRNNGGGQFAYSMNFLQGILDRPAINQAGKLFIITGYDTFSAALNLLRNLEVKSNATILGEAPGDYAASSGDPKTYELKNTQIKVQLSSIFHPTVFENDDRKEILLDKKMLSYWKDYSLGVDPIYNYIKNIAPQTPPTIPLINHESKLGRYHYGKDRDLLIKDIDNKLYLEIAKSLRSPLYQASEDLFNTEVKGLNITFKKNKLKVYFPDGKTKTYKRAKINKPSPLENLYSGDFETARTAYLNIKKDDPNSMLTRDSRFSDLALFAFFELRNNDRALASKIAKGILNLGIEINDGEAPFCKFALRFY